MKDLKRWRQDTGAWDAIGTGIVFGLTVVLLMLVATVVLKGAVSCRL